MMYVYTDVRACVCISTAATPLKTQKRRVRDTKQKKKWKKELAKKTSSRARTRREYRDKEQEKEHVFRSKINDDMPISDVHLYVLLFLVLHLLLSLLLSITNTQNHSRRRSDACSAHRLGILISADCFSGKCRVERGKKHCHSLLIKRQTTTTRSKYLSTC